MKLFINISYKLGNQPQVTYKFFLMPFLKKTFINSLVPLTSRGGWGASGVSSQKCKICLFFGVLPYHYSCQHCILLAIPVTYSYSDTDDDDSPLLSENTGMSCHFNSNKNYQNDLSRLQTLKCVLPRPQILFYLIKPFVRVPRKRVPQKQ